MTDQRESKTTRLIAWTGVLLGLIAIVLAVTALLRPTPEPVQSDYDRAVAEIGDLVEASYDDLRPGKPAQRPQTITQALQPLFELAQPIDGALSEP
jgi:hypothetical protein